MPIAIGVDIGGSHISSAAVDMEKSEIIPGSYFHGDVNNKASKEEIFKNWSRVINQSIEPVKDQEILGVGIAMPGPFRYKEGVALFERNDKYETLYGVSVKEELPHYFSKELPIRFLNDATSFGVGGTLINRTKNSHRVVAITLGTGFGAAFLEDNIPLVNQKDVPEDGCLWDKDFQDGIADDYFSTRWFISKYQQISGKNGVGGVKDLVKNKKIDTTEIFEEFAENMSNFLLPHLQNFDADLLVLGGSIAKSHDLFMPSVLKKWKSNNREVPVAIVENAEEAGIIGSSYLFNEPFWNKIKNNLPAI